MRRVLLLLAFVSASAGAQDSSFSTLHVRGAVLRLPVIGRIGDDWRAKTGGQLDLSSNIGRNEIALGVSRMGFDPLTGHPAFTETMFSLGWTRPVIVHGALGIEIGGRLTDIRMDFDDPAIVGGLRNEEEQLLSALARGRVPMGWRFSGFVEATYGVLMTSTRTPTMTLAVGLQRDGTVPRWLREFLR